MRIWAVVWVAMLAGRVAASAAVTPPAWTAGVDVSALSDLEAHGATYRDADGSPGDAIAILRRHGANLARLRLFVNPSRDFNRTGGATQDLATVTALARRAHAAGLAVLLDLHYADTWADPDHQPTPAAWAGLSPADLARRVESYTVDVLRRLAADGVRPEQVAVGNEVTAGMLWPAGKLDGSERSWDRLAMLVSAGVRGVRAADPGATVMVHVSGGGRAGVPAWFFDHLDRRRVDYDQVGVSFYPTWRDDLDALRQNLAALAGRGKDVVVAEVSYPSRGPLPTPQCRWPATPAGQAEMVSAVAAVVRATPGGHGRGVIWWYPEATPVPGVDVWDGGRQGLFDGRGRLLPAADALRDGGDPAGGRAGNRAGGK